MHFEVKLHLLEGLYKVAKGVLAVTGCRDRLRECNCDKLEYHGRQLDIDKMTQRFYTVYGT
jgi:hypothetical protein